MIHITQCLEASKNQLLGQLRVEMLMFELNKLRRAEEAPLGNGAAQVMLLSAVSRQMPRKTNAW